MGNTNSSQLENKAPEAVTYTSQDHYNNQQPERVSKTGKGGSNNNGRTLPESSKPLSIRKVLLNKPQFQPNISNSPFVGSPLMSTDEFDLPADPSAVRTGSLSTGKHNLQPDSFPSSFPSNEGGSTKSEASISPEVKVIHGFGPVSNDSKEPAPRIPTIIAWSQGGTNVYVTGTFNGWKHKIRLNRSTSDFTTVIDFPPGRHRLKFIVDEEWKCSNDLLIAPDADGNLVNFIDVSPTADEISGLQCNQEGENPSENQNGPASLPGSPSGSYSNIIPDYLTAMEKSDSSKGSSSNNDPKGAKKPPILPPHLEKVLLNSATVSNDDPMALPVPNHVVLNHLYACSIRDGVMAVAGTTRYRQKYMSTVYYRPVIM